MEIICINICIPGPIWGATMLWTSVADLHPDDEEEEEDEAST